MSEQSERVKIVRKNAQLTMEKFGEKLGVTKTAVSLIESGKNSLTDQMAKLICREFNVDYFWLRDGIGEIYMAEPETIVDELADEYKLSEVGKALVKFYVNLDPGLRDLFEAELQKTFQIKK